MSKEKIANFLIDLTEDYLTKSKIRKERFKEKFKKNKIASYCRFLCNYNSGYNIKSIFISNI